MLSPRCLSNLIAGLKSDVEVRYCWLAYAQWCRDLGGYVQRNNARCGRQESERQARERRVDGEWIISILLVLSASRCPARPSYSMQPMRRLSQTFVSPHSVFGADVLSRLQLGANVDPGAFFLPLAADVTSRTIVDRS